MQPEQEQISQLRQDVKNFGTVLAILIGVIFGSTIFFHTVEKWKWLDSIYYVVVTMATVGYGDFTPKTDIGKVYAMILIVVGFGLFGFFANLLLKRRQLKVIERRNHHSNK